MTRLGERLSITHFLHATLLVTHLETAQHFYEAVLGLKPVERSLSFAGVWYQIEAVQIHLVVTDAVVGDRVDSQRLGRNRHIALAVTDLDVIQQRLEALNHPFQHSTSGRSALFVADPDGNIIELSKV
jgi:glyoxylase I family protein